MKRLLVLAVASLVTGCAHQSTPKPAPQGFMNMSQYKAEQVRRLKNVKYEEPSDIGNPTPGTPMKWTLVDAGGMVTVKYGRFGMFCSDSTGFKMVSINIDGQPLANVAMSHKKILKGAEIHFYYGRSNQVTFKDPMVIKNPDGYGGYKVELALINKYLTKSENIALQRNVMRQVFGYKPLITVKYKDTKVLLKLAGGSGFTNKQVACFVPPTRFR